MPKSYNIEYFQNLAIEKNGKCLSSEYKSLNTKLKWQCSKGHKWETIPASIIRGTWCKICAGKAKKTIEDMQFLAKSRGGQCLSEKYINGRAKLIWECANGHVWTAKPDNIKQGKWCPDCSTGLSERICRTYFEQIFKTSFPNTKGLDWLRNKQGNYLELDGYSDSLKLAFEHQGAQHYDGDSYFEKAKYDELKEQLCHKNKVVLIQIPQLGVMLPHSKFHKYLKEKLKNTRFKNYTYPHINEVDLSKAYSNRMDLKMKELALLNRGEFLSKNYLGSLIKHKWKCSKGHVWNTTPSSISSGNWCPKCAINASAEKRKADFQEIIDIIENNNGLCLSDKYVNSKVRIKVQCEKGHTWETFPSNLKKGHWCPSCANQERLTLEEMMIIAKSRKGVCLSKEYKNANSLLMWRCEKGHEWKAPAGRVKAGSWCLKCSGSEKLTLETFQKIALVKGGECLSQEYKNANSKLDWICSEGHEWSARANHVKRGSWCPICRKTSGTKKRTLGIENMKTLAEKFNGECLSTEYINNKTKLTWKCKNDHQFERSPVEIKKSR